MRTLLVVLGTKCPWAVYDGDTLVEEGTFETDKLSVRQRASSFNELITSRVASADRIGFKLPGYATVKATDRERYGNLKIAFGLLLLLEVRAEQHGKPIRQLFVSPSEVTKGGTHKYLPVMLAKMDRIEEAAPVVEEDGDSEAKPQEKVTPDWLLAGSSLDDIHFQ
jgi:hypothetical protein